MMQAMKLRLNLFLKGINSSDGIIVTAGVLALIGGVLVDIFFVRVICLLIVASSALLLIALMRARQQQFMQEQRQSMPAMPRHAAATGSRKAASARRVHFDGLSAAPQHEEREDEAFDGSSADQAAAEMNAGPREPVTTTVSRIRSESAAGAREFRLSDYFDAESALYQGEPEPRTEFNYLLHKILALIKEVLFAHSVVFFWANREKGQMVMEARVSDSASAITARRYPMGADLVSRVAEQQTPELINDVNPLSERELMPYYSSPVSVKSFVGVPVYFPKGPQQSPGLPVAVIAVDGRGEDAFGPETLTLLGQFTKLVSGLIKSYTDKYDLLLDSELLRSIRKLQERVRSDFSLETILHQLVEETSKLVSWDHISVVLHDERRHAWVVKKVSNRAPEGYVTLEQIVDFPDSVVGQAIKANGHRIVDDLEADPLPRYHGAERITRKGSFVSVPVSSLNKCYGALNVESREPYNFSRQDIEMLYRLAENSAFALEILYLEELIREYVIIDDNTGLYAKRFFLQRLGEEMQRADDLGSTLTVLLVAVDRFAEIVQRYGRDGVERMMLTLSRAIRQNVRGYDLVGRPEDERFALALLDTPSNEAYLWAEKIRKNIAAQVINLDGKSFSITVSIGLAGAQESMRKEELMANAVTVLNRATESGGNMVRVF